MLKADGTQDWDAKHRVTEQTAVVRWGRDWHVLATDNLGDEAVTGPPYPSKTVAIQAALRLVERGEYR